MFKRPYDGLWFGLITGLVLVSLMIRFDIGGGDGAEEVQPVLTSAEAAQALVDKWREMSEASWSVNSTFTRTGVGSAPVSFQVRRAQRPPDYIDWSSSTVRASVNGRFYTCAGVQDNQLTLCDDLGAAAPYERNVDERVGAVRDAVMGEARSYEVTQVSAQCFEAYLIGGKNPNNWGNRSRFCFDPATHASVLTETDRNGVIDRTRAISIGAPSDADFVLPTSTPQ